MTHRIVLFLVVLKKKPVQRKKNEGGKCFSTGIFLLKKRVCKTFFLKTIDISSKRFTTVCAKTSDASICDKDHRGKGSGRKMDANQRKFVIEHIKLFRKYKSHYSRKSNIDTRYLSTELNISKLYQLYLEFCKEKEAV